MRVSLSAGPPSPPAAGRSTRSTAAGRAGSPNGWRRKRTPIVSTQTHPRRTGAASFAKRSELDALSPTRRAEPTGTTGVPARYPDAAMGTAWDASTYDQSSEPQQSWASEVLARLEGIAPDATALDVGCGTGRVTEALPALVPQGRVLAMDASADMVALARRRLGDRAEVWCQDVLDLDLKEPVDVIVSTATLHWVSDHDRLWARLARALRPGGVLEIQCGGAGNIDRVREVIDAVARDNAPELVGWSPWVFAGAAGDRAPSDRRGLRRDPVLAGGAPHPPAGRRRVRAHVDPPGAPRGPARGAAGAVCRRSRGEGQPATRLRAP